MSFLLSLLVLFTLAVPVGALALRPKRTWDPQGKHCYVTGGSSGLGLALALLLTKRGADVSIVARDQAKLDKALEEMQAARQTPNQVLKAYSFSLAESDSSEKALEAACDAHGGRSPDAVFLCAGKATPGYFVEETARSLQDGMANAYWTQAWSAFAAAQRMAKDGTHGKIVFVASVLGYMSIVGYSTYSPAKFALRGLAETLRGELLLYDIDVHICFPGTIYSPGYVEENKTKPEITLKIEETDEGLKPEAVAERLFDGVQRGYFHISVDFITDIFRTSTRGATPFNNVVVDSLFQIIGSVALTIWRRGVDVLVRQHRTRHREYLREKGFL